MSFMDGYHGGPYDYNGDGRVTPGSSFTAMPMPWTSAMPCMTTRPRAAPTAPTAAAGAAAAVVACRWRW